MLAAHFDKEIQMAKIAAAAASLLFFFQTFAFDANAADLRMIAKGAKQGIIRGDSSAQTPERIPVLAVEHGISVLRDASGGATGKAIRKPLIVTVPMGASFPQLYDAAVNGEVLTEVTIEADASGEGRPAWTLALKNALIIEAALDARTGIELEKKILRLTMTYQDIGWSLQSGSEGVVSPMVPH